MFEEEGGYSFLYLDSLCTFTLTLTFDKPAYVQEHGERTLLVRLRKGSD